MLLTILLFACGGDPEGHVPKPADTDVTAPWSVCDPTVVPPAPFGDPDAELVADPHSDTFGDAPAPFHVRYGWPSVDPSTSASFLWRTDLDTLATVVEYGVGGELTERVEGASFRFATATDGTGGYRIHEVKLCAALEPATTYSYRVGGDGHWSPVYAFTTPGAPGTFDTFRVAFAGDSRGAYETWGEVLALMDAHDPDFFVFSGDMVELGPDQDEWDAWFEAAGDILARKALVPAHGNHEFLATNYFAQFSLPNNEEWFHYLYGDLVLVSLNDTVRELTHTSVDQVAYMDQAFATDARWKMVTHHQSIYATCSIHGSNLDLRAEWEPVFDRHDVDLVVNGHNHVYERSLPIRAGEEDPDGTIYVVTGGAGAPLYPFALDEWFGNVFAGVEHYVIADFGPHGVDVVARDLAGNVIDSFTLPR